MRADTQRTLVIEAAFVAQQGPTLEIWSAFFTACIIFWKKHLL